MLRPGFCDELRATESVQEAFQLIERTENELTE
jgi:hypothetical protein